MATLPVNLDGTLVSQNDGVACDEWVREAGLFRPLCGQTFYPAVGDETCDVCVSPYVPQVPETPCSVRMLPDPAKTYYLAIDTPFSVSFAYPTLASWKSQTVCPFWSSGLAMYGPWPVNESFSDVNGYRYDFNLGATGNVWGVPAIANVNPIVQPSYVITPGTEVTGAVHGFVGSRQICGSNLIRSEVISQTELIRTSTVNPVADSIIKPQAFATRVRHTHATRVTQQVSYFAHTAASPLNWDGSSTAYGIAVALAVEHFVINDSMQAWYKQLNGSPPWGYPGSELYPYDFSPIGNLRTAFPPKAVCSRFYSFSTTDRAAFMAANSFVLTMTPPPSVIVAPASYPMYDIDDHVTVRTFPGTTDWIEAGYSPSDNKWDSTGPFEWQKVLHTNAAGNFSTGWPAQIRVIRGTYG